MCCSLLPILIRRYKKVFVAALPESRRAGVNFDCPSYPCAAFALCAEHLKVPINKKELLDATDARATDFKAVSFL
jgi:hypothetical protein